jgi:hypothetical protein
LLPQDQLKELIQNRSRNRIQAPKAYFGSWHGGPQNLPAAGFRSNMQSKGFSTGGYSHPQHTQMAHLQHKAAPKPQATQFRSASPAPMQVAAYPPYAHQPLPN